MCPPSEGKGATENYFDQYLKSTVDGFFKTFDWFSEMVDGLSKTFGRFSETFDGFSKTFDWFSKTFDWFSEMVDGWFGKTFGGFSKTFDWFSKMVDGFSKTFDGFSKMVDGFSKSFGWFSKTFDGFSKMMDGCSKMFGGFSQMFDGFSKTADGFSKTQDTVGCVVKLDAMKKDVRKRQKEFAKKIEKEELDAKEDQLQNEKDQLQKEKDQLQKEKDQLQMEIQLMYDMNRIHETRIKLDIGGHLYTTSTLTLTKDPQSMLAIMFSGRHSVKKEEDGSYFIDRDGTHFRYILNYLRDGGFKNDSLPSDRDIQKELLTEAEYYQLRGLVDLLRRDLIQRQRDATIRQVIPYQSSYCQRDLWCNMPW